MPAYYTCLNLPPCLRTLPEREVGQNKGVTLDPWGFTFTLMLFLERQLSILEPRKLEAKGKSKSRGLPACLPHPHPPPQSLGSALQQVKDKPQNQVPLLPRKTHLKYLLRSSSKLTLPLVLSDHGNKFLKLYRKAECQVHFGPCNSLRAD